MIEPPGIPNTTSTLSLRSISRAISAPVFRTVPPPLIEHPTPSRVGPSGMEEKRAPCWAASSFALEVMPNKALTSRDKDDD